MGIGVVAILALLYLAIAVFLIAAVWKMFTKARQPGWAAIVPFYNTYVLIKITGRPGWWLALMFIPLVNIVIAIIVVIDLAKAFGKGGGFAALLIFLPFVGYPILGFGSAVYRGPMADPRFQAWVMSGGYGQQPGYPPLPAAVPAPAGYGYPPQPPAPAGYAQPGYAPQGYQPQPGYPNQPYPGQGQPYPGQQYPGQPYQGR